MTLWFLTITMFLNCFNGVQFVPENGLPKMVSLINFEEPEKNSFKVVNQLVVEYTNRDKCVYDNRLHESLVFLFIFFCLGRFFFF